MVSFTKQEKTVLLFLSLIILFGSIFQMAIKRFPHLPDIINVVDRSEYFAKVDINSATKEELIGISYIGVYTAGNIIAYREAHGPFKTIEEIKKVKGIRDKNYQKFYRYLKVLP